MKQNLTFHRSTIESTASRINVDAFDESVEAFDKKEYLKSFHLLLDYTHPQLREKYGNAEGTSFKVPHGSIIVHMDVNEDRLNITAPFLALPEKGRIPLLRQTVGLNFQDMDLAQIVLKDDKLNFEYSCPIDLVNPYKIYYVLQEICRTGDKYDDEFETKFGATRIYEPEVVAYEADLIDRVHEVIQESCRECNDALVYFEKDRKYGFAWNVIAQTLYKILYFAHPQGQLLNDLNKAVKEHDREDIPLPEVISAGKKQIERIQGLSKEELAEDLYHVDIFISQKRRSSLTNIQENFENMFEKASKSLEQKDYMACAMMVQYKFYEIYFYNNVQDDINAVVTAALEKASGRPWEEAAPILHTAMKKIMENDLEPEEEEENADADVSAIMGNIQEMQQQAMAAAQQAMAGFDMAEYMKNIQNMMGGMMGAANENDKEE